MGVWIEIADNGPGFPEAIRDQVFQPFASGKVDGTGLGLMIVHNLVLAHGGRLDVLGQGDRGGASIRVLIPPSQESAPDA